MRWTELLQHCCRRRGIWWSDDSAKRNCRTPWHVGYQQSDHDCDNKDGERNRAKSEACYRAPVGPQVPRGRIECRIHEDRRDEQRECEFGISASVGTPGMSASAAPASATSAG